MGNRQDTVSIDRLKEALVEEDGSLVPVAQPPRRGRPPLQTPSPNAEQPANPFPAASGPMTRSSPTFTKPLPFQRRPRANFRLPNPADVLQPTGQLPTPATPTPTSGSSSTIRDLYKSRLRFKTSIQDLITYWSLVLSSIQFLGLGGPM